MNQKRRRKWWWLFVETAIVLQIVECASSSPENELDDIQAEDSLSSKQQQQGSWSHWWSYDGISGPDYWNINKRWRLCSAGRMQSPVDVRTERLIYDHLLGPLQLIWSSATAPSGADQVLAAGSGEEREQSDDKQRLKVELANSGRGVEVWLESAGSAGRQDQLILSGGPLSYAYKLYKLELHSSAGGESPASEHLIDGRAFEGELQLHFYNLQLAQSAQEAQQMAHEAGLPSLFAGLAVMLVASEPTGASPLDFMLDNLGRLNEARESRLELELERRQLEALVSSRHHYVTYSGSLNRPPCLEGVDWILLNKPLPVPGQSLSRRLQALDRLRANQDNVRPARPLNGRLLRTTIDNRRHHLGPNVCKQTNCSLLATGQSAGKLGPDKPADCSMRPNYSYQLSYGRKLANGIREL